MADDKGPLYYAADQFRVIVTVDTPGNHFDKVQFSRFSGGDLDSSPNLVHPGGMLPAVVASSRRTVGDITVEKPFEYGDMGRIFVIADLVGTAKVTITKQPLTSASHASGHGLQYTGVLKGITQPAHDADSEDQAMWSLVVTPDDTLQQIGDDPR